MVKSHNSDDGESDGAVPKFQSLFPSLRSTNNVNNMRKDKHANSNNDAWQNNTKLVSASSSQHNMEALVHKLNLSSYALSNLLTKSQWHN